MRRTVPLLLAAALVAGCTEAGDGRYPSLLPRAIESATLEEPVRPVPVAAPDPALDTRIASIVAGLDQAARSFATTAQNAEARIVVARGVPAGSEAWLDAQAAITEVTSALAPVDGALGELEEIAIQRGEVGLPPYPALDAAIARASALATEQAQRAARLEAALSTN